MDINGTYPSGRARHDFVIELVGREPAGVDDMLETLTTACELFVLCSFQCHVQKSKLRTNTFTTKRDIGKAQKVADSLSEQCVALRPFIDKTIEALQYKLPDSMQLDEVTVAQNVDAEAQSWIDSFVTKQNRKRNTIDVADTPPAPEVRTYPMFHDELTDACRDQLQGLPLCEIIDLAARGLASAAIDVKLEDQGTILEDIMHNWDRGPEGHAAIDQLLKTYNTKTKGNTCNHSSATK